ncbi:hypothetical protein GCM10025868_23240 [Angustibacter aerolatus]|uniref:Uncharacterized protein n=1 Tax=Angustibacter aerolatus TaxID=1162965 RepID=A0ABQ6JGZ3_9ACTN|nr:hypothetical protein GCM10025868_23240 [Angustibacter aerolatus]
MRLRCVGEVLDVQRQHEVGAHRVGEVGTLAGVGVAVQPAGEHDLHPAGHQPTLDAPCEVEHDRRLVEPVRDGTLVVLAVSGVDHDDAAGEAGAGRSDAIDLAEHVRRTAADRPGQPSQRPQRLRPDQPVGLQTHTPLQARAARRR